MSAIAWLDLDLLSHRRKDSGQIRTRVVPTASLVRRGVLLGAVLPSLLLLWSGWLLSREYIMSSEIRTLKPAAQAYAQVDAEIISVQREMTKLSSENAEIAKAITDVRSSSAFLIELQRTIPVQLKLDSIVVNDQDLTLTGKGLPEGAFTALNAFLLRLQASSFLESQSVVLDEGFLKKSEKIQNLNYTISGRFADNAAEATANRLMSLGAQGIAFRLKAITQLGMLQ